MEKQTDQPESTGLLANAYFTRNNLTRVALAASIAGGSFMAEGFTNHSTELPPIQTVIEHEASPLELPTAVATKDEKHCSTIRRRANDIYVGFACAEDGDGFTKVDSGYKEKGWVYGVVAVKGIYKCGFVREGALPDKEPKSGAVTKCRKYYTPFTKERYKFYTDYNCPEAEPGLEGCKDGTFYSRIHKHLKRCDTKIIWRNYATAKPSPLNLYGTGYGGFTDKVETKESRTTHYRVKLKPSSKDGRAAIVRRHEWGYTPNECIPHGKNDRNRRGGPKIKS